MKFSEIVKNDSSIQKRRILADDKIKKIKEELFKRLNQKLDLSIFCAGSLGRGDVGSKSDLDLFILSNEKKCNIPRLETLEILSEIIGINKQLGFQEFSNDGQYLKVYSFPDMLEALGSPKDDNDNLFTVRLLLLLESKGTFNEDIYQHQIKSTIEHYFRDKRGRSSFKPLFLLNDLLRYWRTLCLNYELIRDNPNRPWRKKNINLKFSRMLTVFSTVLPIIAEPASSQACILKLVNIPPMERLAYGLDVIGDDSMLNDFQEFISCYECFIVMKEDMGARLSLDDSSLDRKSREMANMFSDFLFKCLTHNNIKRDYVKYLFL